MKYKIVWRKCFRPHLVCDLCVYLASACSLKRRVNVENIFIHIIHRSHYFTIICRHVLLFNISKDILKIWKYMSIGLVCKNMILVILFSFFGQCLFSVMLNEHVLIFLMQDVSGGIISAKFSYSRSMKIATHNTHILQVLVAHNNLTINYFMRMCVRQRRFLA